jgi:major membrane immunogen (membrane-anchored lipoprotein)
MPTLTRLTLATMIGGLLLTGCAEHKATRTTNTSTTAASSATTTSNADATGKTHQQRRTVTNGHITATDVDLPDRTGIPACDDYLSSYLACHRAAAIYAPNQLQSRYEAMRTSLLRDSENPDIRPQLAARCNSLATQLRQALHGKSCAETPAAASSTP